MHIISSDQRNFQIITRKSHVTSHSSSQKQYVRGIAYTVLIVMIRIGRLFIGVKSKPLLYSHSGGWAVTRYEAMIGY